MRLIALVALGAGLLSNGCSAQTAHVANSGEAAALVSTAQPLERPPYHLQPGDRLEITFYRNPELDEEVVVRPDGKISLPFVDDVMAAGRTPAELDAELTRRYTGELATAEVTVIVTEFAGHRVFVGGEVGTQGALPISGRLTLYQAIQEAGGFLPTAHRSQVVVVRRGDDGARISRTVNLHAVQKGSDLAADVYLAPYDVVWVPRSAIADVNLFVEQVFRENWPIEPNISFDIN